MVRRSIALSLGLILCLVAAAAATTSTASAQPRQPRVRPADETTAPETTTERPLPAEPPATVTATQAPVAPVATDPSSDAAPGSEPSAIEDAPAPSEASRRVRMHDFGAGYRSVLFNSNNGTRYNIHGPSVAYTYFVGRRWGFMLHGEAAFPIGGRMSGVDGQYAQSLIDQYDERRYSFDVLLMAARRFVLSDTLSITAAFGAHMQSFELKSVDYLPVEAITGGLGGLAKLDWLMTRTLSLGATVAVGADLIDFVRHVNPAVFTMPVSATLSLGVRY